MQAARYIADRQETDLWAYTSRDVAGGVARFGSLDDLHDLKRGGHFELRPFALGRLRRRDAAEDIVAHGYDESGALGLDLKWHVTQDLTLDAAVMPDFAQVEADQLILNLTNVETFLPEKRALFLEGAEAFATPLQVFYSRRIGNAPTNPTLRSDLPTYNPMTDTEETLVEVPETALIYGAAKLVGNLNSHWTVGAMSAFTAPNEVAVQEKPAAGTGPTTTAVRTAQPAMSFNVLRLKRELGRNAYLGVIGTGATVLREQTSGYPAVDQTDPNSLRLCPSGATINPGARCFHDAYLGGLDGFWRSESGNYMLAGQVVESLIENGPPAGQSTQLLDGTVINPGDHAPGGWLRLAKEGGKPFIWSTEYTFAGRKLDYNDLGFQLRQNLHELKTSLGYRTLEAGRYTIDTTTALELDVRRNLAGLDLGDDAGAEHALAPAPVLDGLPGRRRGRLALRRPRGRRRHVAGARGVARRQVRGLQRPAPQGRRQPGQPDAVHPQRLQHQRAGLAALAPDPAAGDRDPAPGDVHARRAALRLERVDAEPDDDVDAPVTASYLFGDLTAKSAGGTLRASYAFTPTLTLADLRPAVSRLGPLHEPRSSCRWSRGSQVSLSALGANRDAGGRRDGRGLRGCRAQRQRRAALGVPPRLDAVPGLFAVADPQRRPPDQRRDQLRPSAVLRGSAVDVLLVKLSYWWAS